MNLWVLVAIVLGAALILGFGVVIARGRHDAVHGTVAPRATMSLSDLETTVRQLVEDGRPVQAIRVVRAHTGLRLAAAKRFVEMVGSGESAETASRTVQSRPSMVSIPSETLDRIGDLAARGHTIQAIKELREHTGMSLKEAKEIIDQL